MLLTCSFSHRPLPTLTNRSCEYYCDTPVDITWGSPAYIYSLHNVPVLVECTIRRCH